MNDDQKKEIEEERRKYRTPVDQFLTDCRDKWKVHTREFNYKPDEAKDREQQRKVNDATVNDKSRLLKENCEHKYGELYSYYIHLKRLRLVVDIAMRFGASEPICTILINPKQGKEKTV